jgi:hypothetical protein
MLVFIIFLLISTLFWFMNVLRENYSATFTLPVRYVNMPENEVAANSSNDGLRLKVRGGGYAILRQKMSKTFSAISVDVSKLNRMGKEGKAFLLPSSQRENIQRQLYLGLEAESIEPDTLFIQFQKTGKKTVAVANGGNAIPDKQFILSGAILFSPDSVVLEGPINIIDTITAILTEYYVIDKLQDTVSRKISLNIPKEISVSQTGVQMTVPVEAFSETSVSVPIGILLPSDSLRIKTFPSEVKITYRVGISKFDKIKDADFNAVADAESLLNGERPARLRVRINQTPSDVYSYDYTPYFVEYLIEHKY